MTDDFEINLDPKILDIPTFDDLEFVDNDGIPTAFIEFSEKADDGRIIVLRITRDMERKYFSVGQVAHGDIGADEYDLRHVRLFMNEFGIPGHVPVSNNMIGPISTIEVIRIMRLIYATFDGDLPHRDQIIYELNTYIPKRMDSDISDAVQGNVVPIFG